MNEQEAKSKVHLRLLGRSIATPSEAREVIEIVWKAAAEFFQAQQPMPEWMQYDPSADVLAIHGKKYAASLFGKSGFLGHAGDILRIEQGPDDVVTVTKIQPEPTTDPFGYFKCEFGGWVNCSETDEGAIPLYERPPAAEVKQEPVAARFRYVQLKDGSPITDWDATHVWPMHVGMGIEVEPLYTHPAPAAEVNAQLLEQVNGLRMALELIACTPQDGDRVSELADSAILKYGAIK